MRKKKIWLISILVVCVASGFYFKKTGKLRSLKALYTTASAQDDTTEVVQPLTYTGLKSEYVIPPSSFSSQESFDKYWKNFYPWGTDHNGTARMTTDNINLLKTGVLKLTAEPITDDEGSSPSKPFLKIAYHSGAITAKPIITVTDSFPEYEVSGYFNAPIKKGTWPAFWLTATKGWPPEIDILEYKGGDLNWQNTFGFPRRIVSKKIRMFDADKKWHFYKVIIKKLDVINVSVEYYIDNKLSAVHKGVGYLNKPMWLIINLQMEGASGTPGPTDTTTYLAKNVLVKRWMKN